MNLEDKRLASDWEVVWVDDSHPMEIQKTSYNPNLVNKPGRRHLDTNFIPPG